MERISVTTAARSLSEILNRVLYQGTVFELERGNKIIARLSPANPLSPIQIKDLNQFFAQLPSLDDDAESFAKDIKTIRQEMAKEQDPWA
ncbi:antitoxin [Candidatus Parabeggiatoa sp. HSG14]|uniref:antitoxin n=1 Tax=Candidatus Parabeggiatoa sp. HSG14 TaxID=3055593 RepID=UPI0025A84CD0|nr:antitoxin [Thiotrichales bacterium HSG14]